MLTVSNDQSLIGFTKIINMILITLLMVTLSSSVSGSVIWYPPLSQPVELGKVQTWGLLEEEGAKFRGENDKSMLSSILKQDQDSEEPEMDNVALETEDDNIEKRNVFGGSDPVFYEDYDYDEDEPEWTKVGNGRVKILPLTFGK